MKFEKHVLCDLEKCYATLGVLLDGEPYLFFAGEGRGSLCAFHGPDFGRRTLVWEGGGGTMSIAAIPGEANCVLASRGFYSMVDARESSVEIVARRQGAFSHRKIAELPYLHRFDVLRAKDGSRYLIACTLASHKESKTDWSHPGGIFFARLPENLDDDFTLEMQALPGDYTANHGFCRQTVDGREGAFIGCREGVFQIVPPAREGGEWEIRQIMDFPVSDLAVMDIDDDGELEFAVISPFHGDRYSIFKGDRASGLRPVYEYPVAHDFYHTVVAAELAGRRVFIGGGRKLAMQLFVVEWDSAKCKFVEFVADEGVGPSNAAAMNLPGASLLLSANRQIGQAAFYRAKV